MKILFFIGTLGAGGKERRLLELLSYLKSRKYSLVLVVRKNQIDYPIFYQLEIPYIVITDKYIKKDITLFYKFYNICKKNKPDIIHTWGSMPAFISIPTCLVLKIPHINSQITDAPPRIKKNSIQNIINKINFIYSTCIIANSNAGLVAYKINNKKCKVIYNGLNLSRFVNLKNIKDVKAEFNIKTEFAVIMVASFIKHKNYDLFIDVAKEISFIRNDVSFIAVGDGYDFERIKLKVTNDMIPNVIFTGKISNVEQIVNTCDIGILFSPLGEGLSNSILEYMALGKPVIANDIGGNNEIIIHGINGYLITNESIVEIASLINNLLINEEKRFKMGAEGKNIVENSFSINRMGIEFESIYNNVIL